MANPIRIIALDLGSRVGVAVTAGRQIQATSVPARELVVVLKALTR